VWAADLVDGRRVVVRQPASEDEFRILQIAPLAPKPLLYSGDALVMTRVDGEPDFESPDVKQMAQQLLRIHRIPPPDFLPRQSPATNPPALLHGDYWPGNILWQDGQITAIIDWEDAQVGDPLSDVANARLEILFFCGEAAMHSFTQHYQAASDSTFDMLPFWDMVAAYRAHRTMQAWGLDSETRARIRQRLDWFTEQAMRVLVSPGKMW
jgi:hypothetical protein